MSSGLDKYSARWPVKRLEQLAASIQYGYTAKAKHERDGPRYLRITDIQDENVDWAQVPSCEIGNAELKKYRLYPGDLVFARTGATVGKSYLIRGVIPQSVFASYLIRVQLRDDVEPRYVAYFFRSPSYWRQISESQAGIGQPNVNGKKLAQIRIPVAPLDEQRQIVTEIEKQFSRLDDAVANLRRVKANLKRYKAAVLKAAVEGRLVPTEAELARREGRSYETGTQLLQRILETRRSQWKVKGKYREPAAPDMMDLPELPEGWVWAAADQVCSQITDGEHIQPRYQSVGYPMLTAKNVRDGFVSFDKVDCIAEKDFRACLKRCAPIEGDVLIVSVGATTGRAALVGHCKPFALVRSVLLLRPLISSRFLLSSIQAPWCQTYIRRASGSTAQSHLYIKDTRTIPLPLPPLAEQHRVVAEVDRRLSFANEVEGEIDANLKRAERLRSSVLSRGFAVSNDRT